MTSLAILKWRANCAIDQRAGLVRLKYITDVEGQQAVYLVKLQEAQAFTAALVLDAGATPPPYIAACAAALGRTPVDIAEEILALAEQWNTVLGPSIEAARLAGKWAVDQAGNESGIDAAMTAAINALEAL